MQLTVEPGDRQASVDSEDWIRVAGASPHEAVELRVECTLSWSRWRTEATFVADGDGRVDSSAQSHSDGDWSGIDPFGPYWSAETTGPLDAVGEHPLMVRATARSGTVEATASWHRAWAPPNTTETEWAGHGVVGRLIQPARPSDSPAVVILSGSDGGLGSLAMARLLAGHGITALPIGFWNLPGLPEAMADIDIEVVAQAARHLRGEPGVPDHPVSVVGVSRGGELALLAGAHLNDDVGSTVSIAGSAAPWGAFGDGVDVNLPAWRLQGIPVPKLWEDEADLAASLTDPAAIDAAAIPVERTRGRVLLLTGTADLLWPATQLSEIAVERARSHGASDRVKHVAYDDAGHLIGVPPGVPVPSHLVHPVDGSEMAFGGTPTGNRAARRDAWQRLVTFLLKTPMV